MRPALLAAAVLIASPVVAAAPTPDPTLVAAIASPTRTPANAARDRYRHPAETLAFFGVHPGQTVAEFLPSGGWWTEILAPVLSGHGHYIALASSQEKQQAALAKLISSSPRYGGATAAAIDFKTGAATVPDGSVDVVLTFRNVHNLVMNKDDAPQKAFAAFYRMLKPGGTLGVEDHRLPESMDSARELDSGYIKRSTIVKLATAAGFRLAGESNVNANPKDTHDWPKGVWTLPPTYELGDVDKAKYAAIGESDRLTLKFVKPK